MQTLVRALPDRFASLTGATRDLTASTAHLARRELGRVTRRELDRAKDLGGDIQRRLGRFADSDKRSARLPVAVSVLVLGAAVGGALLASPRVRGALRQGWDRARGRRPAAMVGAGDGPGRAALSSSRERQEHLLDQGIEESFPASDPVSVKRIT